MDIAQNRRLLSWKDVGKALADNDHRWARYLSENGPDSRIEEWLVALLDQEASRATDGNIGVELVEVRPDGVEVAYTDDFIRRAVRVVAPPLRDVHDHACDNCGAAFSCACDDPGQERADCGGCKRDDERVEA